MNLEYCVMHNSFPDEPHRWDMSLEEAEEWIREAEEDGIREGLFYVGVREVSPWRRKN